MSIPEEISDELTLQQLFPLHNEQDLRCVLSRLGIQASQFALNAALDAVHFNFESGDMLEKPKFSQLLTHLTRPPSEGTELSSAYLGLRGSDGVVKLTAFQEHLRSFGLEPPRLAEDQIANVKEWHMKREKSVLLDGLAGLRNTRAQPFAFGVGTGIAKKFFERHRPKTPSVDLEQLTELFSAEESTEIATDDVFNLTKTPAQKTESKIWKIVKARKVSEELTKRELLHCDGTPSCPHCDRLKRIAEEERALARQLAAEEKRVKFAKGKLRHIHRDTTLNTHDEKTSDQRSEQLLSIINTTKSVSAALHWKALIEAKSKPPKSPPQTELLSEAEKNLGGIVPTLSKVHQQALFGKDSPRTKRAKLALLQPVVVEEKGVSSRLGPLYESRGNEVAAAVERKLMEDEEEEYQKQEMVKLKMKQFFEKKKIEAEMKILQQQEEEKLAYLNTIYHGQYGKQFLQPLLYQTPQAPTQQLTATTPSPSVHSQQEEQLQPLQQSEARSNHPVEEGNSIADSNYTTADYNESINPESSQSTEKGMGELEQSISPERDMQADELITLVRWQNAQVSKKSGVKTNTAANPKVRDQSNNSKKGNKGSTVAVKRTTNKKDARKKVSSDITKVVSVRKPSGTNRKADQIIAKAGTTKNHPKKKTSSDTDSTPTQFKLPDLTTSTYNVNYVTL